MALYFGTSKVQALYLGEAEIQNLYLGSTLVWTKNVLRDEFDRADASNLGSDWLDESEYFLSSYGIGVVDEVARIVLPDGLLSYGYIHRQVRYIDGLAPAPDGYIEIKAATSGANPDILAHRFYTRVFGRNSNSDMTHGVGIQLEASKLAIVRRVASIDTVMVECGSFSAGDVLRLTSTGNLHTLTRNGSFAGEWNDSGATAQSGASYRALGISMYAGKDLLGPRRFSPTLEYVEFG